MGIQLRQMKITVDAELVAAYKDACVKDGVSMATDISSYMSMKTGAVRHGGARTGRERLSTRRQRRQLVRHAITELEEIMDAEEQYMDRIPENLRGGSAYDAAVCAVDALGQAIELLAEAF
jgi:hypothetical protein